MTLGILIGWATVAGLVSLAGFATLRPDLTSVMYGVPMDDPSGHVWVRAAGLRDAAIGAILTVALTHGDSDVAAVALMATAGLAVIDIVMVVQRRGWHPLWPFVIHGSGVVAGFAGAAAVVFAK